MYQPIFFFKRLQNKATKFQTHSGKLIKILTIRISHTRNRTFKHLVSVGETRVFPLNTVFRLSFLYADINVLHENSSHLRKFNKQYIVSKLKFLIHQIFNFLQWKIISNPINYKQDKISELSSSKKASRNNTSIIN